MITHVVIFTWQPGTTDEQAAAARAALLELPGQIGDIRTLHVGPDLRAREGNGDFAVVGTFDDIDAWRRYSDHPAHQAVVKELIAPHLAARTAVQFES